MCFFFFLRSLMPALAFVKYSTVSGTLVKFVLIAQPVALMYSSNKVYFCSARPRKYMVHGLYAIKLWFYTRISFKCCNNTLNNHNAIYLLAVLYVIVPFSLIVVFRHHLTSNTIYCTAPARQW